MGRTQADLDEGWKILLDVIKLERIDPWRIRLTDLLRDLEIELEQGKLGLSIAGVAIYNASHVHRKKSERLFEIDKPQEPRERPNFLVPPPLDMPIKPSIVTTTLLDVVQALKAVLLDVSRNNEQSILGNIDIGIRIDDYLIKLEEEVEWFFDLLSEMLSEREAITFRDLVAGVGRLEAAKRFILLLIAASRGRVEVYQEEESGEIVIRRRHAKEGS